ncbi:MAG: adenylate/guanylate cyclase domain-containing protein [Nitrospirota bacterium]
MLIDLFRPLFALVPRRLAVKLDAPLMAKDRLARGREHPTIRMNLANLLLCSCFACPSFPKAGGEALYCASGVSSLPITENGCNCVTCPLYDRCSSFNVAYFCVHGHCGAKDDRPVAMRLRDLAGTYLERFTIAGSGDAGTRPVSRTLDAEVGVTLHFSGDKDVRTTSKVPILEASLGAGIPHTHVCGGRARCSTCRVLVSDGLDHCRPRNEAEARLARIKGFSPEIRLACQTTVFGDVTLRRLVLDDTDIQVAMREGRADPGEVGREAEVSVLFCDIRSFTAFAERALPYDVIHILNRYFETIGAIIDRHGGYIDKYMGDGIMVIFGLDRSAGGDHARLAVSAARSIARALPEFNRYLRKHFNHEFRIGVGVHSGTVILGSLGFHKKKEYTALGDTVNTASRIEAYTKEAGTTVLVSESTRAMVSDRFSWGKSFDAAVKGKQEPLRLHELLLD